MSILPLSKESESGIIYYEVNPNLPADNFTYLLLHGLGNSLDFWSEVTPVLARLRRVIAIDIPGFGRSPAPSGGFTLENVSRDINAFCITRNVQECIIVAHSLGSFMGLRLAALNSERFRRLVLVDGTLARATQIIRYPRSIWKDPSLGFYVGAQFIGGMLPIRHRIADIISRSRVIREITLWPYVANPGNLDPKILGAALSDNGGATAFKVLLQSRNINYIDLMKAVSQPVDLVWGEKDHLIDLQDVECARHCMQIERELKIPACGHWPMIEAPAILSDFLLRRE
jgi:pimeloyl-ACP methyl ester carboxylesterase